MPVLEKVFAALVVVVCIALLVRLAIGARRRAALDRRLRRSGSGWSRKVSGAAAWPGASLRARREAAEAIRRARRTAGERDGNVVRPDAFKGKRRDLH